MSSNIEADILEGGWRALCAGLLVQATKRMAAETNLFHRRAWVNASGTGGNSKEGIYQKKEAQMWIDGGRGLITFEDCCEVLGVDPARARKKIRAHCERMKRKRLPNDFLLEVEP